MSPAGLRLTDERRSHVRAVADAIMAAQEAAKLRGSVDVVTLQTLARHGDIAGLTAGYGLVVADECHHVPAAAFEDAIRQVRARRWLGLTATPYRRDKLDDLYLDDLRYWMPRSGRFWTIGRVSSGRFSGRVAVRASGMHALVVAHSYSASWRADPQPVAGRGRRF